MKYYTYDKIEKMMVSIVNEGDDMIFNGIEMILNPIERLRERELFYIAQRKLKHRA